MQVVPITNNVLTMNLKKGDIKMQVVPITRNALVMESDDWGRLGALMTDFNKVCDSQTCKTCPLANFCFEHENPADYLKRLYEFLDD